ncbi:uncharacterized protein PHALS_03754 [Plasmopara halstedii]|uniref:Uncharacterized protein n=1 Tax=Plasmopara halstedii TaxID=4781 RepID=A0A0P1AYY6_PLAHL|nr:uncharacterized protein PHALS_03754 [Plasmopara halstedii]CEG47100.1 hypothetical protein PHALS_03754 [Plasmopara halstedii]|eukprot:XP_024583469.1 hypothetical protein PHALS_03754 [Plasmopara halstedii]
MAGRHATLPVNDLHFDIDEPEQENIERNSVSSVQESVLLMKTSLRQPANTVMQHRPKIEVGPWMPTNSDTVSVINESAALMATKKGRLTSNLRAPDGVTTALLAGNSRSSGHIVHAGVDPQKYGSMQLRHSILRMSASKTSLGSGLRKCASVEFVLDHVHHQAAQSFYASTSSIGREPRYGCGAKDKQSV